MADEHGAVVFSYGGGRQTVAMCVLICRGVLPRPDLIVMADTGRENPSTWAYLAAHVRPMLAAVGLEVQVAPRSLATVDLYAGNGDLLLPVFTRTGKLRTFCSVKWKRRVVDRWLRGRGVTRGTRWLGLAVDEGRRWKSLHGAVAGSWRTICPLVDLMINTAVCARIVEAAGLPAPAQSSCWMCPNKRNGEWRLIRDEFPAEWAAAVEMDAELRAADERGGVWLHHSRRPLGEADIDGGGSDGSVGECTLGLCFV